MPPSKDEVELCALIVDELYGELASRIFTNLLRRGRLTIPSLNAHTRLPLRHLRLGLAILVQHHLVYYSANKDSGITYYEARLDASYALIRSGKIIELVENRYGTLAKGLVQKLLLLGHSKISDLLAACSLDFRDNGDNRGNGVNGNKVVVLPEVGAMVYDLLEVGLLELVSESMFQIPADIEAQIAQDLLRKYYGGSTKGTKQQDELKEHVRKRLRGLREEGVWRPAGSKRKAPYGYDSSEFTDGGSKRRKLSESYASAGGDGTFVEKSKKLNQDLIVRVNQEKFTVALRSQCLVEFARNRIGETTSQVYGELLRLLEEKVPRCRNDPNMDNNEEERDGPCVSTIELEAAMSSSVDVALGIGKATSNQVDISRLDKTKINGRRKCAGMEAEVIDDTSSDQSEGGVSYSNGHVMALVVKSDPLPTIPVEIPRAKNPKRAVTFQQTLPVVDPQLERNQRFTQLRNHLLLLTDDECQFLRKCGSRGLGEWTVDFHAVIERLRASEIERTIRENFGKTGLRLVRVLKKLGKLEDKYLPNLALIKAKDIRVKMVELHKAGLVDIQEIPKDTQHTALRTIHLWYFDKERVPQILLNRTYKAMMRCYQRLNVEKRHRTELLSLAERTDVKEMGEEAALSAIQAEKLQKIRAMEQKMLVQIGRLDEVVGILRDY